jgi:2-polyprenyl-3-methyl-5-hydroxy-6-metoxy-1,4-benzoquinol methylase
MAEHMNLYQKASHYDIIFDRDVGPEIKFLENLYQQHGPGRPLESVLDIACGPGYHARAFARQGVRAAGIDLGEAMIQLAGEKAVDGPVRRMAGWRHAPVYTFPTGRPGL